MTINTPPPSYPPLRDAAEPVTARTIAERLVADGVLDQADLDRALRAQGRFGEGLRQILDKLGLVAQDIWARTAAEVCAMPLVSLAELERSALATTDIAAEFLRDRTAVLLRDAYRGGEAPSHIAMADPADAYARDAIQVALGTALPVCVALARDIDATLDRLYGTEDAENQDSTETPDTEDALASADIDDIERLRGLASEAPIVRLVNTLVQRALESGASDIHIEPFERFLSIRFRIDGILSEVDRPQRHLASAIVSRIKILANLDIAERRLAQDGRIRHRTEGQEVDLRVSTVPSLHGESVVIRVLEQSGPPPALEALGLGEGSEDVLARHLTHRHGLVIVTGPTGSGKTTTLYAALDRLNDTERKIITVEDPVEFQIDRVIQTQARADIGHDFARILRAVLRQDPDILMIGEIRDVETARIAAQSALTGHLVLSTLHTNDAVSAVTRLLDMGLDGYLITATVNLAVAQRLVRILCPACKRPAPIPDDIHDLVTEHWPSSAPPPQFHEAVGCPQCGGRGFKGRMGIFEIFEMDDGARRLVLDQADVSALRAHAKAQGMKSLFLDGLMKCGQGLTTVEEVRRVAWDQV